MPNGGFPQSLLEKPVEARMAYFKSFTMAHPLLKEADAALRQAIQEPAGRSLIFVYGPTGVGKTTLRFRVEKHLKESLLPALENDPGRVPVVSIEAAADSSQFSWKDYYRRALISLEEPLMDQKITDRHRGLFRDFSGRLAVDPRAVGLEIRYALDVSAGERVHQDGRFGDAPPADLSGSGRTTASACVRAPVAERDQSGHRIRTSRYPPRRPREHEQWMTTCAGYPS